MTAALTPRQLSILRHALGINEHSCRMYRSRQGFGDIHRVRWSVQYRNHYSPGGDDIAVCDSLVALGLMNGPMGNIGNYRVTREGEAAAMPPGVVFKKRWGYYV